MERQQKNCPVCNEGQCIWDVLEASSTSVDHVDQSRGRVVRLHCPKCGGFAALESECEQISANRDINGQSWKLRALIQERHLRSNQPTYCIRVKQVDAYVALPPEYVQISIPELITRWPRTIGERLNRCLANLATRCPIPGNWAHLMVSWPDIEEAMLFSQNDDEARFMLRAIVDRGDILQTRGDPKVLHDKMFSSPAEFQYMLTPKGWERLEAIEKSTPTNPAFVAMWFGNNSPGEFDRASMERVYLDGIQQGIVKAGYRSTRVDMEQFNDGIMDQVLSGIRAAPFVVADFTGHRNGVYFEAGFGRGLGIPVIFTCHRDQIEGAHFDTKHINHLVWDNASDLCERLNLRIQATIGKGPFAASAETLEG